MYRDTRGFTPIRRDTMPEDDGCGATCRALLRTSEDKHCLNMYFGEDKHSRKYPKRIWGIAGIDTTRTCCNPNCQHYRQSSWDVNHAYWYNYEH